MASNAVDLEILPRDPIQDARTLKQALPLFNADGFDSKVQQAKEAAVRAVRFLGTPDAVRAMVARYGQFTDHEQLNYFAYRQTRLGLFGFPQPSVVVQEMGRQLADPDFPVFSIVLEDLAQTQLFAAYPQPVLPYNVADPEQNRIRRRTLGLRRDALAALTEQNRGRLAAAVPAKQGRTRAISLYTLWAAGYAHPDAAEAKAVERALVPAFDGLTLDEQNNLLGSDHWFGTSRLVLLPLLRRLYARPPPNLESGMSRAYDVMEFYSLTLHRLTELSPTEGRALLLTEIQSRHPRVDLPTLRSLPDRTLPALDAALATDLEANLHNNREWPSAPHMVERYATRAILSRIKAAYSSDGGEWGGDTQSSLLAYFLRMDSSYGLEQMKRALARRKGTGWYRSVLSDVAALAPGPDVGELAAAHLHDPDTGVEADAVKTLGACGSPAAEAPLWARMREWHQQWAGKAEQITPVSEELEYALSQALATAPGWLADRAKLQTLQSLCVTEGAHGNVAGFLRG